jgi:chemotaxis protein histidine kinase CheA
MAINISDNDPRIHYTATAGQTLFIIPFTTFDDNDLLVYVNGVLKTITSDYTIANSEVTLLSAASLGDKIALTRNVPIERTTDLTSSYSASAIDDQLDRIVSQIADLDDKAGRSIQIADSELATSLDLPLVDDRKGKTIQFNSVTGALEAGPTSNDIATIANNIAEILAADDEAAAAALSATAAAASATAAQTAETAAELAETNAETAAALASTNGAAQVVLATDQVSLATDQANLATTNGAAQVALATTQTSLATTQASNAAGSASTASTQAGIATTKASEASASASAAAASAASITGKEANAAASAAASASSATDSANSAAAAAAALDNFDDRYLGTKSSEPTLDNDGDALVSGALYFDSTSNAMQVYDGANWIAASAAGVASMILYEYTATAGQTTFTGSDDNGNSISFIQGNEIVVFNGIILDPSDYNSTSGTSIVLSVAAALNDLINVYAFKSFTVADTVSASTGGTFGGNVTVTGTLAATTLTGDGSAITGLPAGYTDTDVATYLAGVGNVVVGGTVDGVDIAARDAILTSTTTTANAALPKAGGAMTGAITTNSTFDGRNVSVDGTKLDGIEAGATADQTAAQLLTAVKTVDGSGSGLDADLLDGLHLTSQNRNNQANSVVRTQADGYAEFGWINTTSGDTSGGLSRVYVDTGDGFIRKSTLSHLKSQMGGSNPYTAQSLATNGYIKLVGGLIIQWGQSGATSSGDVNVTFPTTFPSACRSFTSTMTGGIGSENWVNGFSVIGFYTSYAIVRCRTDSGSAGITWMAIGY